MISKIAHARPSKAGLYPHELVILSEATYCTVKNGEIDATQADNKPIEIIERLCKISDPKPYVNDLVDKGFLFVGNLSENLQHINKNTLKRICRENQLSRDGTKCEIINRLIQNLDGEKLTILFPDKWYFLTPHGEQELNENPYISFCTYECVYNTSQPDDIIWIMNQINFAKISVPFSQDGLFQMVWDYAEKGKLQDLDLPGYSSKPRYDSNTKKRLKSLSSNKAIQKARLAQLTLDDNNDVHIVAPTTGQIAEKLSSLICEPMSNDYFVILSDRYGNYIQAIAKNKYEYIVELHEQIGENTSSFQQKVATPTNKEDTITSDIVIKLFENFCLDNNYNLRKIVWAPIKI